MSELGQASPLGPAQTYDTFSFAPITIAIALIVFTRAVLLSIPVFRYVSCDGNPTPRFQFIQPISRGNAVHSILGLPVEC
jgi:hypothetical protein